MDGDYGDVLKRLKEERERLSWSQRDICQYVNISQAQYCKIECGSQYFRYDEIKTLSDLGIDIHYAFTGQRAECNLIKGFENCDYYEVLCLLVDVLAKVTRHYAVEPSDFWKELYREIKYVRLLDADKRFDNNLFIFTRYTVNYTQKEMARLFGIDVKKYRELEKGTCFPDSELLWKLYKEFRIPPSIILKDKKGLLCQAGWFLERMN